MIGVVKSSTYLVKAYKYRYKKADIRNSLVI